MDNAAMPGRPRLDYRVLEQGGGQVTVGLDGHLADEDWTRPLRDFLDDHYIDDGVRQIHLDLSSVDRIDLEGVRTLLLLQAEAIKRHKTLSVTGVTGRVREKLGQTGVLNHLQEEQ